MARINSLISARYLISRQYRDRLQVTSTVGTDPARSTLATGREATGAAFDPGQGPAEYLT